MANGEWRVANGDWKSPLASGQRTTFAIRHSLLLLDAFALSLALLEQLEIALDIGIVRVLRAGLEQCRARTRIVAAQHKGIAPVVEHFRRRTDDGDRLAIGAVGKLEA